MSDSISYQVYDPQEFVDQFKNKIFSKYNKTLAEDDPLFIELEMMAMLAENQRNSVNATLQAYGVTISEMSQKWEEKENEALQNYNSNTEALVNKLNKDFSEVFSSAIFESVRKARNEVDSKWAKQIVNKQEENLNFFKSLLYLSLGMNFILFCAAIFFVARSFC